MLKALDGLKVLDLSRILAGPWATQLLGDFGANVIKVERPGVGDDTRSWGPPYFEDQSAYYLCANRNKRSVALDFSKAEDLAKLETLLVEADVVVENYKTGGLKKYDLDAESVTQRYPKVIYCSISGFGHSGPYADRVGYDALIQAMSGLMSITGTEEPTKVGVAVSDLMAGLYSCNAILAALHSRQQTGMGQKIEVSLYDTQVAGLANVVMNYLVSGTSPQFRGNSHPSIVPYRSFKTADGDILIAVGNDGQFEQLCLALDRDWHTHEDFSTNPIRVKNRTEIDEKIQTIMKEKTTENWLERFSSFAFPHGPVNDLQSVAEDPQTQFRQLFSTMSDGKTPCVANPIRFSRTPIHEYKTPPKLNEDHDVSW